MKKIFLLLPFIFCRCSYNLVEDIQFHQNKTADIKLELDFSKSLDSENKDLIVNLITQGAIGFAESMSGQNVPESDKSIKKNIEEAMTKAKDELKPVIFNIALDTFPNFCKDSIKLSISEKDTLNELTPQQEEYISDVMYYLVKHTIFKFHVDIPQKIMVFSISMLNINWDSLNYYKIDQTSDLVKINESLSFVRSIIPEWNGTQITRAENNYDLTDLKGQELDDETKKAWDNSYLIIRYHMPSKIKSSSNKLYTITNNGNTAVFQQSFTDLYKKKPKVSNTIEY